MINSGYEGGWMLQYMFLLFLMQILHLVWILLCIFDLTCVHSQGMFHVHSALPQFNPLSWCLVSVVPRPSIPYMHVKEGLVNVVRDPTVG